MSVATDSTQTNHQQAAAINSHSEVIQQYRLLQEQGYMSELEEDEYYKETALYNCTLTEVISKPLTAIRTANNAAKLPAGYYSFIYVAAGEGYWFCNNHHHQLQAGSILFIQACQAFTLHFTDSYKAFSFNIPRAVLQQYFALPPQHGELIADTPQQSIAHAMQHDITQAHSYEKADKLQAEQRLLSIIQRQRLCHHRWLQQQGLQDITAIKALIQHHACEEGFDINWLIKRSGLSRRQVFKLFSQEDQSLNQCIQQTQLNHAFDLLTQTQQQHFSIHHIAIESGFKSQAHFSRLFKQRFNITATELRQQAINFQ